MKIRTKICIGRRAAYPTKIEIDCYKDSNNRFYIDPRIKLDDVKHFDVARQQVIKCANRDYLNTYLRQILDRIEEADMYLEQNGRAFDKDYIRTYALTGEKQTGEVQVIATFREYNRVELATKAIKYASWQKYNTLCGKLQEFIDEYKGRKDAPFSFKEFDLPFLNALEERLCEHYIPSSLAKFHRGVKKFVALAIADGHMKENPYARFKIKQGHTTVRNALTEQQVGDIENLDREMLAQLDPFLPLVVDRFLFSVYTGLRISDNASLLLSEINTDAEGWLVVDKVTEKQQGKRVILPLHHLFGGKGEEIARRYMEKAQNGQKTLFPELSKRST